MHERYLFPAIVIALLYSASARGKLIYPVGLSLLCALNMLIILEINGSDIWEGLAWGMVILFALALSESLLGHAFFTQLQQLTERFYRVPYLSVWVFLLLRGILFTGLFERYRIHDITLSDNQLLLTDVPRSFAFQDHGTLQIDRSFDNNHLSFGKKRFARGLGTHSNSDIQFILPENASTFSFMVGLDGEVGTADVQFSVWGDNKLLWESKVYYGNESANEHFTLDVRAVKLLNLKVAAVSDDKWDHANWINTVITLLPGTIEMQSNKNNQEKN